MSQGSGGWGGGGNGQVSPFRGSLSFFPPLYWVIIQDLGQAELEGERFSWGREGSIGSIALVKCDFFFKLKLYSSLIPRRAQLQKHAANMQDRNFRVEKGLLLSLLSSGKVGSS